MDIYLREGLSGSWALTKGLDKGNFLLEWLPLFLIAFSYSKKIDLPTAHHQFAQREGCARQVMRCIVHWTSCIVHCALWIVQDKWCVSLTVGRWCTHDQGTQSINIFWNEFNLKSLSLKHSTSRDVTRGWYSQVLQTSTLLSFVLRIPFWWIAFDILLGRYSEIATTKTVKFSHLPCAVLAKTHNISRCILKKNNANNNNYIVLWRWWY